MELTEPQRKRLRGLAHRLRPCIQVGQAGVTPALLAELSGALSHHELVKVRVRMADRETRDAAFTRLALDSGAVLVSRIGHTAVLFRPGPGGSRLLAVANGTPP